MKRWPHQQRALDGIESAIAEGFRTICLSSPTGGGKTRIAVDRMKTSGRRTVFYTNRRMLFEQTSKKFHEVELNHGFRASGYVPSIEEPIQLAMIQSE